MQWTRALMAGFFLISGVAIVAGCTSTTNLAPIVTPTNPPAAPSIPTSAPASTVQSVALSTPAPAAVQQIPISIPTVAGYAGSINLPIPASLPSNTAVSETISNTAIDTIPVLQGTARSVKAVRSPADSSLIIPLLFMKLAFSTTVTFPNAPAIIMTVPDATIVPGVAYYLAEYNPLFPGLGWQKGFEGPAAISGSTLTFAAPSPAAPITFPAQVPIYFGLYAVSLAVSTPSPAPSATPAPTPSPIPAFSVSPSTTTLLLAGATSTATIADPSGYTGIFAVGSTAPAVASATVSGKTVTITALTGGATTITVVDTQGRSATINVIVTLTNIPLQ